MRSSLLFFMLSVTVSAQPPPVRPDAPIQPQLGGRCCAKEGVADPTLTCQKMGLNSFCVSFLAVLLLRVSERRKKNCNNNNLFCFAVHRPEIFYFKGVRRWDRKRSGWAPCSRLSTSKRRLWFYCVYWMRINESFHSTH